MKTNVDECNDCGSSDITPVSYLPVAMFTEYREGHGNSDMEEWLDDHTYVKAIGCKSCGSIFPDEVTDDDVEEADTKYIKFIYSVGKIDRDEAVDLIGEEEVEKLDK